MRLKHRISQIQDQLYRMVRKKFELRVGSVSLGEEQEYEPMEIQNYV